MRKILFNGKLLLMLVVTSSLFLSSSLKAIPWLPDSWQTETVKTQNQQLNYLQGLFASFEGIDGTFGVQDESCFFEDFDAITNGDNTTTGGSGTAWTGNANFPTVDKAYQAGGTVKLGTGSATGFIESMELADVDGDITVNIMVKGWTNIEGQLKVSIDGQEETLAYTAKMADAFEQVTATFTGVAAGSKLKIETTAKRAFIDEVEILCEEDDAPVVYSDLVIGTGTSTSRYPLGHLWGFERSAALYTASELSTLVGTEISKVGWYITSTGNSAPTKVYLTTTTSTALTASTWANMISGATLVYDANVTPTPANSWYELEFDAPFNYTGDNLLVLVETNYGGTGGGTYPNVRYSTSTNHHQYWNGDNNAPTGNGTLNSNRPNIRLTYAITEVCSGAPDAGTVSSPAAVNPGTTYSVTASGFTIANGLSFQWQSNTNGEGWVNQGSATNMYEEYTATASTTEGDEVEWRLAVSCGTETTYSTTSTTTVELVYCTPNTSAGSSYYISNFSTTGGLVDINNSSGGSTTGYQDFSDIALIAGPGMEIDYTITAGTSTYGHAMWIDWNKNGVFESNEQFLITGYESSPYSSSFTIPSDAEGDYRMRVLIAFTPSNPNNPCVNSGSGEYEDYTISIQELEDCSGTPEGGAVSVNPTTGNPDSTYTVSATGYEIASGLTFQWQSNTNGEGWVNEGAASTEYAAYTATAPAVGSVVEWQLVVTCENGGESGVSTSATFTTELVYCSSNSTSFEPISRVIFADIDNASATTGGPGYEDFTAIVGNVEKDETYEMALEGYTGGNFTNYFTIWIDWNQNGTFEASEMYEGGSIQNSSGADGQQAISSITVPEDALDGETRMRIVKNYNSYRTDPCGSYTFGQVEDYTINVIADEPEEPIEYCEPAGTNSSYYIDGFVTTGGVTNISNLSSGFSAGGYGDFYDTMGVTQTAGEEVSFTANFPASQTYGFRIWVDWNKDGEFDTTEEVAWNSTGYLNVQSGTFTVPASASLGDTRMRIVGHWLNSLGDIDPCSTNHTYGEFEDYKFTVLPMDDCSGTPEGGVVSVDPSEANGGDTYIVSASGFTVAGGMSYQWQSNTDGAGWVNEGTATQFYEDYVATAPEAVGTEVEWKLLVTCLGSTETVESTVATFTTTLVYCTPTATSTIDYLSSVSTDGALTDIQYSGTAYSYVDQTSTVLVVSPSLVFDLNTAYVGGTHTLGVWIDWDGNGTFGNDPAERIHLAYGASPQSVVVTVPSDVDPGNYRMRVRGSWSDHVADGDAFACNQKTYGTAIDFTVNVIELDDCSGEPEAGTVSVTPTQGAPSSTYVVSATGFTIANGLTFQWQSNTDGEGWVNEGAATSEYEPYTATAPAELGISVDWQLVVTCTASGESAESTTATFTTGVVYCDPSGSNCSDGDLITNVTFEQINNDSGCSPNGYGDYTHLVAGVNAGETYPIEVTVGDGWYERVSVWIDFGNDGSFDPEDYMGEVGDGGQGETLFDFIEIPATVQPGQYRMRIALGAVGSSNPAPEDPCAPHEFGETEDYTIQVNELGVTDLSSFEFAYYPNPVRDVLNITTKKEVKDVSVFNLTGQKVMSNAKVSQGQIDVTALTPGTYVFRVTLEGGQVETFKIIKR